MFVRALGVDQRKLLLHRRSRGAHATVVMLGVMMMSLVAGVLAIDLPTYFVAQNQLQTAVNAAALAGAYQLSNGTDEAEVAAYAMAAENRVINQIIPEGNLRYRYSEAGGSDMVMMVDAQMNVPTILGKLLCKMNGGSIEGGEGWNAEQEDIWSDVDQGTHVNSPCKPMKVVATAKAVPAARDTILVIDTSSSMSDGVQPIYAVKAAAKHYVDMVLALDSKYVDRIAVVDFNRFGFKKIGLTSHADSSNFYSVKSAITNLKTYSSSTPGYVGGWNTNYYIGLKTALDEMEANGRENATKNIIFLTDGKPNLPAPPKYGSYYGASEYRMCSDPVHSSTAVKNLMGWHTVNGQKRYYKTWQLPYYACYQVDKNNNGRIDSNETSQTCKSDLSYEEHAIKNSHVEDVTVSRLGYVSAAECGQQYIDYITSTVQSQIARAKEMGVTIHTIEIYDPALADGNSINYLQRISTNLNWDPGLVELIAQETEGQTFAAVTSDTSGITSIYEQIAQDVKVKLAH